LQKKNNLKALYEYQIRGNCSCININNTPNNKLKEYIIKFYGYFRNNILDLDKKIINNRKYSYYSKYKNPPEYFSYLKNRIICRVCKPEYSLYFNRGLIYNDTYINDISDYFKYNNYYDISGDGNDNIIYKSHNSKKT
jgi:hypothetical protein